MVRLARIEALLGASIDEVGEKELFGLISGKVPESQGLDFTREHCDATDEGQDELASEPDTAAREFDETS